MATSGLVSARQHPEGFLEACPRPETGRRGEVLAGFLQSDVQADLATARAYLDEIAAAARGEKPRPGGAGNAFWIAIQPTDAVIRNIVLEGAAAESYSLAELRAALEIWIEEIERAGFDGDTPVRDGSPDKPGSPQQRRR
jgi:hypothetical protein